MRVFFRQKIFSVSLFLLIFFLQPGFNWKKPWNPDEISYKLQNKNGYYVLKASLKIEAQPDCLLQVIYSSYHMQELMKEDADLLEIVNKQSQSYKLRSVHKNKLCSLDTIYQRDLAKEKKRVNFELIECIQKSNVVPKLVSSRGYYEVLPDAKGSLLNYYEETRLEARRWDPRAMALVKMVEHDTLMFLKKIKKYSEKTACHSNGT